MTDAAHTPSAWYADKQLNQVYRVKETGFRENICGAVYSPADRALIAAGPALLSALEVAQTVLSQLTSPDAIRATSVMNVWAAAVEAEAEARAVIAAAKGE